jgi:RNA ligase (TIGR02306 family)
MSDIVRKLASVQMVEEIKPIEGADKIEAVRVLGWWVVAQKGEYEIGDLAIYLEIDSFCPTEIAPFLSKDKEPREYNGVKGERLRTVKLKKQISQGLLLPLDTVGWNVIHSWKEDPVGTDLTELLGIQKWEAPINAQLAGMARGNFPSFVPKTDQERIQNCWRNIERVKTERFEVTQKCDGSSMTAYYRDGDFGICSRNLDLKQDENNAFWKVALRYGLPEKLEALGLNIAIQGELIGPGIQGNPERLTDLDLFVFDIFDINKQEYLKSENRLEICEKLGLKHCPILYTDLDIYEATMESLLKMAEGKSLLSDNPVREGLVFKSIESQFSFKCISDAFLLGEK